jgi:5S rRNA maturation endonuclease (ribonuclease M5)
LFNFPPGLFEREQTVNTRELLSHLQGVKISGKGWTAFCPAHEDKKKQSLSVSEADGKILLHCFTGCPNEAITGALNLKVSDLFLTEEKLPSGKKKEVAVYRYDDENKNYLYEVVRYEPKDFRPRVKQADGSFKYSLEGVRRVPYRLPELLKSDQVIIVEGEKDVHSLNNLEFTATTTQGGANAWRPEYTDCLTGKDIIIIPDLDQPGQKYAEIVSRSLHGKAKSTKIIMLPLGEIQDKHGKDVSDWIELNRKEGRTDAQTRASLSVLIQSTPEWDPESEEMAGLVFLDSVKSEPVEWLWRGRIPLGKLSVLDGDPGLGKSTIALDLAARVSQGQPMPDGTQGLQGGTVLLSMEDGPS